MFFCPPYTVEPCGLFTVGHLVLFLVTAILIALGLWLSRGMDARAVCSTVRVVTALLWVLEIAKILFVLLVTESRNPNDYMPLYFCSLVLFAGAFSSLGKGIWQRLGDVFLATGSFVGGVCFLVCPNTSLPRYPTFHFISWHSFLLHGLMVYLALLLLMRGVCRPRHRDVWLYAALVGTMCIVAFVFNLVWDATHPEMATANLMFMSKDFPGTPVSLLYHLTGPVFPLVMGAGQSFLPFYVVYSAVEGLSRLKK
jgi:uncharacterized membrane protein YwaF